MRQDTFATISGIVKARSGILLTPDKDYMFETRLRPMMRRDGIMDFDALAKKMKTPGQEKVIVEVVEAMTTNESSFFRDGRPFDYLKRLLPRLAATRPPSQPIRVWSAACSSGQEAYSIAMVASELGIARRVQILGTDISKEMLDRGKEGLFSQFEVQRGLPVQMLVKHFRQEGQRWRVAPELRGTVKWQHFNLLESPRLLGRFDIIFCRNVLIYFDPPTKSAILNNLATLLPPDGVLLLGGSESVLGLTTNLVSTAEERSVYQVNAQDVRKTG